MVVKEINFARKEDTKQVLFQEFNAENWGNLVIFVKGSVETNQMVCNWIKQWTGETDDIIERSKMLEFLIIRVNNEMLEFNKVNGTKEYISLTLVLLQNNQRWFASFGGNYVIGCKKTDKTNKYRTAIDFGTNLQCKLIGQQEIHSSDSRIEQESIPGQTKHYVEQKKYKVDTEHERILLFASEYKKYIHFQKAKEILFISRDIELDQVFMNVKRSLQRYINNKKEKNLNYYTLHGYLIEPRYQVVSKAVYSVS